MTNQWWNSFFNLVLNFLKLKELATIHEICVSRTWFDDKLSTSWRIFWHFCSCCFKSIFFFNRFNVFSCSKWSTYESSWFCFRSFLLSKFSKIYHLFFQRNKSFSIFHLKKKSRSTFLRIMFDSTLSRLIESWRSTFSFSLSCFIDAFSTKNRTRCANESDYCRINNTMRSFKNEALNVVFLL
jgi:hypothetical protein